MSRQTASKIEFLSALITQVALFFRNIQHIPICSVFFESSSNDWQEIRTCCYAVVSHSPPQPNPCWRAHIKLHGLGQCNNVPRYLAVFFLSDEVLPSIKLYCITSQGSLRLHATVDLKVPTAECTRTGKPCTLHPHLAPPKEKVVRASALGMPAATKMDEFSEKFQTTPRGLPLFLDKNITNFGGLVDVCFFAYIASICMRIWD